MLNTDVGNNMCVQVEKLKGEVKKVIYIPCTNYALVEILIGECTSKYFGVENEILTLLFINPAHNSTENFANSISNFENKYIGETARFVFDVECNKCYSYNPRDPKIITRVVMHGARENVKISKTNFTVGSIFSSHETIPFMGADIIVLGCGYSFN